ncbi:MAG: membrane dipeptidase [Anaerolineae bacterium]|nr:membrane dipeptidase [Anaerolineae bacterium]
MPSSMIVIDAHEDIAYNYAAYGRDYRQSAYFKREREVDQPHLAKSGISMVGLPDALIGRVGVVFSTLFVAPRRKDRSSYEAVTYSSPQEAYQQALVQWDYYQRLVDEDERMRLITSQADLDVVLASWQDGQAIEAARQGLVILMEGADPILEPKQFEEWFERGVRVVGMAWEQTRYSGGTHYPGGLTPLGRELLDVLASFPVILDLSHMAEVAYFEALDRYEGAVVIASHSNPRKFVDTDRQLSDLMIRRLAERDGVMGIVPYNWFLSSDWRSGDPKAKVPFERVLDAIDYVCQITGSAAHVGLGSDFDGGFGVESTPQGFDTVSDLWTIGEGLRQRGYAENDIAAVLSGNMLRKLRQALP